MDLTVLLIIGIILILIGLIGSIIPALPGPPLAYVAVILLFFNSETKTVLIADNYLWVIGLGIITLAVTILDYYLPIWGTKKYGGTKAGVRGSTIGLIVGFVLSFFTVGITILLGPLVGAYLAEKNAGQTNEVAIQSAKGTFIGFITGTFMKVAIVVAIAVYFLRIVL
jgi:uncharacterized protein YqgC (DUF456 family)